MSRKKVAIVYDWIDKWGGIERVLIILHEMFPEAEFFTSYYDSQKATWATNFVIKTSFIQRLPNVVKKSRRLSLVFYPYAFESFDFSDYDLVISVSSSFAKGIITKPSTLHLSYLLTPTRFLWISPDSYGGTLTRSVASPLINHLMQWDRIASTRPDAIASISKAVAVRCQNYYDRRSRIIYPPFDQSYWTEMVLSNEASKRGYYLIVSRLEPYKKIAFALEVFAKMPKEKLIVIGTGTDESRLKAQATGNIEFVSNISDKRLAEYYHHAKALIMTQEEDFGYASLEAQSCGCPVVAFDQGGARETVVDGKTGLFFSSQSADSLQKVIERFDIISGDIYKYTLKQKEPHLASFARDRFEKEFMHFIQSEI